LRRRPGIKREASRHFASQKNPDAPALEIAERKSHFRDHASAGEYDMAYTRKIEPSDVVSFWFAEETKPNWFEASEEFDAELRKRFGAAYLAARGGQLDEWAEDPGSALALVLLLDQIPRNIHRNTPEAFATDTKALNLAKQAIEHGHDMALPQEQRQFLYLPFMHSEQLAEQERGMELYGPLGLAVPLDFMRAHRDIIARFGRFPHRNRILGRANTEEEEAFLKLPGSHF
jgi:uncharacterized protein (DUF924 family)